MRLNTFSRHTGRTRSGKTLVLFVLLAPVLIGMMGLVLDVGMLMASYRQTQNAADAAAVAAAMDLFRGYSNSTALTTAQSFVTNNGVSATLTVTTDQSGTSNVLNIPPATGPHSTGSTNGNYAEVIVSQTVNTFFIQILGVNSSHTVTARAVAGYEPVGAGEGCFVLDSTVSPGLSINNNNTRLIVNGDITVNSTGGGVDQYGNVVTSSFSSDAVKTSNAQKDPAPIVATTVNVVGGVTSVGGTDPLYNIRAYDAAFSSNGNYYDTTNTDRPLIARLPIAPDPLVNLATPTVTSAGTSVNPRLLGSPAITNNSASGIVSPNTYVSATNTTTLYPGVYESISINAGIVNFQPGIYVLSPQSNTTTTFNISGGTVTGSGVMFYNTGSDYNPNNGGADTSDGNTTPPQNAPTNFGKFSIGGSSGSSLNFSPLVDANSPFNGMLFYQRRWNTSIASFTASSGATMSFSGTLYAKWAQLKLSGNGTYNAQFLVGSMAVDGGATVTINASGKNIGQANLVFLVE